MIVKANSLYMPLKDKSVQAIISSPPYWGLRSYDISPIQFDDGFVGQLGHEKTPQEFINHLMLVMYECWRVLKDDGVCFINLGDTFIGGGMNGHHDKKRSRYSKDNTYPQVSCKVTGMKRKSLAFIPERFALACLDAGWIIRNKIIWYKPNGMPNSVTDRFSGKHEQIYMLVKQQRYCFNLDAVREKIKIPPKPKNIVMPEERSEKWVEVPGQRTSGFMRKGHTGYYDKEGKLLINPNGKNPGDVWEITTSPYKDAHFATFPEKLVERMLLCSTAQGDIVLDPFGGSGTVGRVAIRFQRKPVLLDLGYHDQQAKRLKGVQVNLCLT